MHFIPTSIRGPLFMIVSTGSYLVNDTMMKLATAGLPSYEVLFLRGVAATLWGMPLLFLLGYGKQIPLIFDKRVLRRNLLELAAILCYVVALANMQIADSTALGQITPLLMLVGSSILFGERIGGVRMALIGLGFIGALMVAQPTMQGISVYALLALGNAALAAARDLAGRRVAGRGAGHDRRDFRRRGGADRRGCRASGFRALGDAGGPPPAADGRRRVLPDLRPFLHLHGLSRRADQRVAPFYYCFTVWAVISGAAGVRAVPQCAGGLRHPAGGRRAG